MRVAERQLVLATFQNDDQLLIVRRMRIWRCARELASEFRRFRRRASPTPAWRLPDAVAEAECLHAS
jgi:hypothetical protein